LATAAAAAVSEELLDLVVSDETYRSGRGRLIQLVCSRYEHAAMIDGIVHHEAP
jgi:hypothetical protein